MLNISPAPVSSAGLTFGTITRVQSASGNVGNAPATSFTITFGANLTVGNLVVYAMHTGSGVTTDRVSDASGNNAFTVGTINTGTAQQTAIGFMIVQTAGTVLTMTAGVGGNFTACGVAVEYSGAKFRAEAGAQSNTGSSASPSTGTLVTNGANELIVAAFGKRGTYAAEQTAWLTSLTNSFSSVLQTSSFTNTASADATIAFCERIVNSAGSYSTAATQANTAWGTNIVSFISD